MSQRGEATTAVKIVHPRLERSGQQGVFELLDVPPRSRLYGLEPRSLDTVWTESLTSYINRLGWRHGVSPRAFAAQEIGPLLDAEWWHYPSPRLMSIFCAANAMSLNGWGTLATTWSTILEQLTQRADLHCLTAPWWIGDLPNPRNLRSSPAWCPACYTEWKRQGLPIYQPVLWMLQVVTTCLRHNRRLMDCCPFCKCKQSVIISHKTRPGECTKCALWLGSEGPASWEEELLDDGLIKWQDWVVCVLNELRAVSLASGVFSWKAFFTSLAKRMEQQKGYSQLARLAEIDRSSLYQWVGGTVTSSLEMIFKFCYVCDTTPMQIMADQFAALEQAVRADPAARPIPQHRPPRQRFDREKCLSFIQAILDGREEMRSVRQVAKRLKCAARILRFHFPLECEQMTQQYREYRKQQREKYLEEVREEVRNATLLCHMQGKSATRRSVAALLKDPAQMRMPEARKTWQAARQELALTPREVGY